MFCGRKKNNNGTAQKTNRSNNDVTLCVPNKVLKYQLIKNKTIGEQKEKKIGLVKGKNVRKGTELGRLDKWIGKKTKVLLEKNLCSDCPP